MTPRRSRRGFTLIELLLVLGIVVILASLLIPISLRMQENNLVPRATDQLQGALSETRGRAGFVRRSQGLRLLSANLDRIRRNPAIVGLPNATIPGAAINANYMAWYDKFEFIEDPGDFTEGWVWAMVPTTPTWVYPNADPIPAGTPITVPQPEFGSALFPPVPNLNPIPGRVPASYVNRAFPYVPVPTGLPAPGYDPRLHAQNPFRYRLFGPLDGLVAARTPVGRRGFNFVNHVLPGDRIELFGNGQVYEIIRVLPPGSGGANFPSSIIVDRPLPYDIPIPANGRANFRIIRQARPVAGLRPVQLPQDVVVELINPFRQPMNKNYPLNPAVDHDIPALQEQNPGLPANANVGVIDLNARDPSNQVWMRGLSTIKAVPGTPVDIMFSPSGQVVNRPEGMIHLWLHRYATPATWFARNLSAADYRPESQALVTIYSRTGTIANYRVNQTVFVPVQPVTSPTAVNSWPWYDALFGRSQGISGL